MIVAGKIKIYAMSKIPLHGVPKEINNLISYLHCFLDSSVYPGNDLQSAKVIRKMLVNAHLSDCILSFSFPKKIRLQFRLQKKYCIHICKSDSAFDFFIDSLLQKNKLACTISIDATGKERRFALQRVQKIILDSAEQLQSLTIRKRKSGYIITLKFRLKNIPRKILPATETLTLAVYALQETLAPK